MIWQESKYFFEHINVAIGTLRLGRQRPDNKKLGWKWSDFTWDAKE